MKLFTAIVMEVYNDSLVMVGTSRGDSVFNKNGLSFDDVIDFFIVLAKRRQPDEVFICFASQSDNEFLFSTLPNDIKDKIFKSYKIRVLEDDLQDELSELDFQFATARTVDEKAEFYFGKCVNRLSLDDLADVKHRDYKIRLINGKFLSIKKSKHFSFVMYDVFGFFRQSLYKSAKTWLSEDVPELNKANRLNNDTLDKAVLKRYLRLEADYIVKLAEKLDAELVANDINITKFYGATAISSWLLSSTKAKNEFNNYRYKRQTGQQLHTAVAQAYYGGRIEQFKIGTVPNKVFVYDINSAYAYAASLLPVMLSKMTYTLTWREELFSLWYCEYDFTQTKLPFGIFPNRKVSNVINYPFRGSGYFWYPEIKYVIDNFPDCINIRHGFVLPYERAKFTHKIAELYQLRCELQQQGNPLEKVLKLALAAIYGKFVQRDGKSFYYNLMYAGFITSLTRSQLLQASRNNEHNVICFLTDAIHSLTPLSVEVSTDLGAWKKNEYSKGEYIDIGIYRLWQNDSTIAKTKTMGFRQLDFDLALQELQEHRVYTALSEIFIGHNLHTLLPMKFSDYLALQQEVKKNNPLIDKHRSFDTANLDLTKTYCDSSMVDVYTGRDSAPYHRSFYRDSDSAKDSLTAGKV